MSLVAVAEKDRFHSTFDSQNLKYLHFVKEYEFQISLEISFASQTFAEFVFTVSL